MAVLSSRTAPGVPGASPAAGPHLPERRTCAPLERSPYWLHRIRSRERKVNMGTATLRERPGKEAVVRLRAHHLPVGRRLAAGAAAVAVVLLAACCTPDPTEPLALAAWGG